MPNTKPYNKEEVMKEMKTRFVSEIEKEGWYSDFLGEDDKYIGPVTLDGKFDFNFLTDFLNQALTAAEQAGEDEGEGAEGSTFLDNVKKF